MPKSKTHPKKRRRMWQVAEQDAEARRRRWVRKKRIVERNRIGPPGGEAA